MSKIDVCKQRKLNKIGNIKRSILKNQIKETVKHFYTIGQCCITKNEYPDNFKRSILFYKNFGEDVIGNIRRYNKEIYTRINYQNCINPAFNIKLIDVFLKDIPPPHRVSIERKSPYKESNTVKGH